jgi:aspartate kinase
MKVSKFGGSSLANAAQFEKVKNIILSDPSREVVVVSALGRENSNDHKITDLLYLSHAHVTYGVSVDDIFEEIKQKHLGVIKSLGLDFDLEGELNRIRGSLKKNMDIDALVSRGEYLSACLMASYLGYHFVDAKELICIQYNGQVDLESTYAKIQAVHKQYHKLVIPGFYGVLPNGKIKVMSRGGSDITGSLVAAALNAEVYENWTDVSGILMADPRLVPSAKTIDKLTFAELREMAFMGASVLHEESIQPVKDKNIPLNIRNTNDPKHPGTLILNSIDEEANKAHFITGVTGRQDFTVLSVYKEHIAKSPQVIREVLEILERFECQLEHLTMGIDSFTIVAATTNIKDRLYDIVEEIKKQCLPDKVVVEEDLALIAVVGRRMKETPGVSGKLFSVMGQHHINIRMIAQGTDEISIIVGISNPDFTKTIQVLYNQFIGQ